MKKVLFIFCLCLLVLCSCELVKSLDKTEDPKEALTLSFVSCSTQAAGVDSYGLPTTAKSGNVFKKITLSVKNTSNSVMYIDTANYTGKLTLANKNIYTIKNTSVQLMQSQTKDIEFFVETLNTETVNGATFTLSFLMGDDYKNDYSITLGNIDNPS